MAKRRPSQCGAAAARVGSRTLSHEYSKNIQSGNYRKRLHSRESMGMGNSTIVWNRYNNTDKRTGGTERTGATTRVGDRGEKRELVEKEYSMERMRRVKR